ncbi:MAG: hypothetical protein U0840_27230 [Gemmataceae bacterium]
MPATRKKCGGSFTPSGGTNEASDVDAGTGQGGSGEDPHDHYQTTEALQQALVRIGKFNAVTA